MALCGHNCPAIFEDLSMLEKTSIPREKFELEPGFEPRTSRSVDWCSTNAVILIQLPAHAQTFLLKTQMPLSKALWSVTLSAIC